MSEVFDKAVKKGLASLGEIPSPFEVARKSGLNIPTMKDIEDILSIVGPQADIKAMVEESSRVVPALKKGDILEAISSLGLATLAPLMIGIPGTVSGIRKGSEELTSRNVGARMSDPVYAGKPIEQTLKLQKFAQKQAQQLGPEDASKIIGEGAEGLPALLYHRIHGGREPFKKFILKSDKTRDMIEKDVTPGSDVYDFLSTGLSKKGMSKWTSSPTENLENITYKVQPETGERVIIGMGKVDKLFDHNNPKHIDDVIKFIRKDKQKSAVKWHKKYLDDINPKKIRKKYLHKIKTLDGKIKNKHRFYGKQEVNPAAKDLEPWEIDESNIPYFINTELPKGHPKGQWWGNTPEDLKKIVKDLQGRAKTDYDFRFGTTLDKFKGKIFGTHTPERISNDLVQLRKELSTGNWIKTEDRMVQHALKQLGYDAFTTIESGMNVMLFNPNEQFIPLFDPLKKSAIGFSTGGGLSDLGEK